MCDTHRSGFYFKANNCVFFSACTAYVKSASLKITLVLFTTFECLHHKACKVLQYPIKQSLLPSYLVSFSHNQAHVYISHEAKYTHMTCCTTSQKEFCFLQESMFTTLFLRYTAVDTASAQ